MRLFPLLLLFALAGQASAAPSVHAYNDATTRLSDFHNIPLHNGNSISGGGDIFEIGYFSEGMADAPFAGEWNVLVRYRIGDKNSPRPGPGMFRYHDPVSPTDLLGGTNLAIRFYDAPTLDGATYFNTVTDATGAWTWTPGVSTDPLILSFAASTLTWQDGSGSAFRTTIPVPEPGSWGLAAAGLCYGFHRWGRRRLQGQTAARPPQ